MKDEQQHAPGTDPNVHWQHHFEPSPAKERWDKAPVNAHYPTKLGYDLPSPVGAMVEGKRKAKRAKIRMGLEHAMFRTAATLRDKAAIRSFLGELSRLERLAPSTTEMSAVKIGALAVIWIFEPKLAPLGECPKIKVPWSSRFKV